MRFQRVASEVSSGLRKASFYFRLPFLTGILYKSIDLHGQKRPLESFSLTHVPSFSSAFLELLTTLRLPLKCTQLSQMNGFRSVISWDLN